MSGFWGRATCSVLYGAIVITQQFKGPASLYRTWRQPLRGSKAVLIYQAPYSPTMPVRRSERHFGAKFALLRSFLIAIRFFAPPLQTATAAPGCGLVFAVHLETASLLAPQSTSEQASYRLLRLFSNVRAHSFCSSSPQRTRFAELRCGCGFGCGPDSRIFFGTTVQSRQNLCVTIVIRRFCIS